MFALHIKIWHKLQFELKKHNVYSIKSHQSREFCDINKSETTEQAKKVQNICQIKRQGLPSVV